MAIMVVYQAESSSAWVSGLTSKAAVLRFHPNVYSDGTLCLDIIQEAWSPCHNVCTILTSIQSLLTDPNCDSPANPDAAQAYQHKRKEYNRTVRRISQRSLES